MANLDHLKPEPNEQQGWMTKFWALVDKLSAHDSIIAALEESALTGNPYTPSGDSLINEIPDKQSKHVFTSRDFSHLNSEAHPVEHVSFKSVPGVSFENESIMNFAEGDYVLKQDLQINLTGWVCLMGEDTGSQHIDLIVCVIDGDTNLKIGVDKPYPNIVVPADGSRIQVVLSDILGGSIDAQRNVRFQVQYVLSAAAATLKPHISKWKVTYGS